MANNGINSETSNEMICFTHERYCMYDGGFFKADPLLSVWKSNIVNGQDHVFYQLMDTGICVQELCACLGTKIS